MRVRKRRKVRLHLDGMQSSLEGLLVHKPITSVGHYVLDVPAIVVREDATNSLQDETYRRVLVPAKRVLFFQEA